MPVGPDHLVAGEGDQVGAEAGHVDRQLRDGLRGVHHHRRADGVAHRGDLGDRVDGAEHVGDVGHRDDLGPLVDQALVRRRGQVEPALVGDVEPAQRGAGPLGQQLPRHDVGVVLHHRDDDLVARPQVGAQRVGAQVERLGGVLGEHDLLGAGRADELRQLGPGRLERLGRLGTQQVHRPGHVGVVHPVEVLDRVDHDARLLRGVRAVQVDQRPVPRRPLQDREVGADARRRTARVGDGSISSTSATETVAGYSAWAVMAVQLRFRARRRRT